MRLAGFFSPTFISLLSNFRLKIISHLSLEWVIFSHSSFYVPAIQLPTEWNISHRLGCVMVTPTQPKGNIPYRWKFESRHITTREQASSKPTEELQCYYKIVVVTFAYLCLVSFLIFGWGLYFPQIMVQRYLLFCFRSAVPYLATYHDSDAHLQKKGMTSHFDKCCMTCSPVKRRTTLRSWRRVMTRSSATAFFEYDTPFRE